MVNRKARSIFRFRLPTAPTPPPIPLSRFLGYTFPTEPPPTHYSTSIPIRPVPAEILLLTRSTTESPLRAWVNTHTASHVPPAKRTLHVFHGPPPIQALTSTIAEPRSHLFLPTPAHHSARRTLHPAWTSRPQSTLRRTRFSPRHPWLSANRTRARLSIRALPRPQTIPRTKSRWPLSPAIGRGDRLSTLPAFALHEHARLQRTIGVNGELQATGHAVSHVGHG